MLSLFVLVNNLRRANISGGGRRDQHPGPILPASPLPEEGLCGWLNNFAPKEAGILLYSRGSQDPLGARGVDSPDNVDPL